MTENTYILAVDPGNEKTGVAIVTLMDLWYVATLFLRRPSMMILNVY